MLLQAELNCPSGRTSSSGGTMVPGILDSPTLARVERAMLRHEEGSNRESSHRQRHAFTQLQNQRLLMESLIQHRIQKSLLPPNFGKDSTHAIKKGLLWQQRDKLFSRWKERYFILTRDYLHCFRRASGSDKISEMGQFLFKIKLVDVDRVEWENKKTYSTVSLVLGRDGKIFLRAPDGLEDWFELLEECTIMSKERRIALRSSHDGKSKDNNNVLNSLDEWMLARQKIPKARLPIDTVSTRQDSVKRREWIPREEDWENPSIDNRLSLLTDIDINSYNEDSLNTTPSVSSYRMNEDVLCIQPSSLRQSGSFRSRNNTGAVKRIPPSIQQDNPQPFIKYRERSYSDIQRVDRRIWRPHLDNHRFQ